MKGDVLPERLVESASDPLTRELIAGACAEAPPPERANAWLAAALSASGAGGMGPVGPGAWYATKLFKGLVSLVTLGALGIAATQMVARAPAAHDPPNLAPVAHPPPTAPVQSVVQSEPSPPSVAVTDLPLVPAPPAVAPARAKPAPPEPSAEVPTLAPQIERLRTARALLQGGDASGAISAVADYEHDFVNGAFWPEAEAIAIDALVAAGRATEARERARRFLRLYGDSPQAKRIENIAGI